jgi:hypothetical protein
MALSSYTPFLTNNQTPNRIMPGPTTALLTDFPKLAELPENDLKDVLSDDRLCNAVLFTVPAVTAVMDEQERLSRDNEELASEYLRRGRVDGFPSCSKFELIRVLDL